jgi:hypothetical protein
MALFLFCATFKTHWLLISLAILLRPDANLFLSVFISLCAFRPPCAPRRCCCYHQCRAATAPCLLRRWAFWALLGFRPFWPRPRLLLLRRAVRPSEPQDHAFEWF